MGKDHKGHPSGINKSEEGTGVPASDKYIEDPKRDEELTNKYTNDDMSIVDNVLKNNQNRNPDKGDATNAGGYKGGT
jgi:hypothetical protein